MRAPRLCGQLAILSLLLCGSVVLADGPHPAPPMDLATARQTWAFGKPREPVIPAVRQADWARSPIDRLVLAKLEERGMKPAPPAERAVLIRRAYFDLIGLPPEPQEVDAFVNDPSPDAFAKVVDHLLATPQYGERWARHWLDVMRYTDSFDARGLNTEGDSTYAYRYRDWVVRALNQDMPYDQFITNQIAGDLLPGPNGDGFNADGLIATSIYTIGNWPGGEADRKKMMTDMADDQVDVTGRAFLGVTLACARCHDHKFDPISQTDYYGLAGIFLSTHFLPNPGSPATGVAMMRLPLAPPREVERRQQYAQRVAELQKQLDQFADAQYLAEARATLMHADQYLMAAAEFLKRAQTESAAPLSTVAKTHQVDAYQLSRWVAWLGPMLSSTPRPALLTRVTHQVAGFAGVDALNTPDNRTIPGVLANNTDKPVTITTLTLPPHTISVHPGTNSGVGVGWTSPISGVISVRGSVTDADPNCGDGIDWRIEVAHGRARRIIASGSFANGSSQSFADGRDGAALANVQLRAGDRLQLLVFPKETYECDSTLVDLHITERAGAAREWNLAQEVVPDFLAGGGATHADRFGNPETWSFFETEPEKAASSAPGGAISEWVDAAAEYLSQPVTPVLFADALTSPAVDAPSATLTGLSTKVRDELVRLDNSSLNNPPSDIAADLPLYRQLTSPSGPIWGEARKALTHLPAASGQALAAIAHGIADLQAAAPPPVEQGFGLLEGGIPQSEYEGTHDCHLMIRGRYDRPGPIVPRGFPKLLAGDAPPPALRGSGRLELARWIASADNPMTAKVMVNRIWQHHFGYGIVRTPGNFGKLGVPPTHPELLDWLARRFVESGWSIKQMHRLIMLSSTYQQASAGDENTEKLDPDNQWLGRMSRRRLEAEPFRDALLKVSGKLDLTMGGPAFRELTTPRRTLYLLTIRSDRSNYRMLFDAADPTGIVDQRIDSTVAPQALFLLNNPFAIDLASALAERCLKEGGKDDASRVVWIYRRLYGRSPSAAEQQIGLATLAGNDPEPARWKQYCQVLLCADEFIYVD